MIRSPHRRRLQTWAWVLTGFILAALPWLVGGFRLFQLNLMLTYAIALIGLNVLTGWSGQISLGHGALFALGAYASGLLTQHLGLSWVAALPCAAALGWLIGWLIGLPAVRLGGHELALATFALALAVPQVLKHPALSHWTGGAQGLILNRPSVPSALQSAGVSWSTDQFLYGVLLVVLAGVLALVQRTLGGSVGRQWRALRDHPLAARALGTDVARYKTLAFAYSASITSLAGACYAPVVGFIAPDSFPAFLSLSLLVGLVIGGLGWLPGCVFGAAFIQFVPNLTDSISLSAPWALYGLTLIVVLVWMPTGVAGLGALQPLRRHPRGAQSTQGSSSCVEPS
jgi:branched-chain amino acid transport system permease protein